MSETLLRPRRDGWTTARQAAFLAALAGGESIGRAAAAAGMSRRAAYRLRDHPAGAAVAAAWHRPPATLTVAELDEALARGRAAMQRAPEPTTAALIRTLSAKKRAQFVNVV